jgi:hypothetical protein
MFSEKSYWPLVQWVSAWTGEKTVFSNAVIAAGPVFDPERRPLALR